MSRRKKKMIYKDRDGKVYKIEGTVVDLSKGSLEDLIGEALDAEADDKIIKKKVKKSKISSIHILIIKTNSGAGMNWVKNYNLWILYI